MCHVARCVCLCLVLGYLPGACSQQVSGGGGTDGGSDGNVKPTFVLTSAPKLQIGSFTWLADSATAPASTGVIHLRAATHDLAGLPYPGASITFSAPGATLSATSGVTDANGQILLTLSASATGDFNAVATLGTTVRSRHVSFIRSCAGMHFAAASVVTTGSTVANSVARGDLDGDGDLDLVAEVDPGHVKTMLNNGSAVFTLSAAIAGDTVTLTGDGLAATLEDMNNDGRVDVVTSLYNNPNSGLGIYPNTGNGTLGPMQALPCGGDQRPTLGDLDGDGTVDIASSSYYGNTMAVCLNNSSPFAFAVKNTLMTGGLGGAVALLDYDRDGRLDMVVGNPNGATQNAQSNRGTGAWFPINPVGSNAQAFVVASADFNGDGAADVAMCDGADGNARVLLGDGTGGFGAALIYPGMAACVFTYATDLNGDGAPDLVLATTSGTSVAVLANNGNGTFGAPTLVDTGGPGPAYVTAGDFNGDGALDLVAAVIGGVSVMLNQCN